MIFKKNGRKRFQLSFPNDVYSTDQKVMFTIRNKGPLTLFEISSYANLPSEDVKTAVRKFLNINLLAKIEPPAEIKKFPGINPEEFSRYNLAV